LSGGTAKGLRPTGAGSLDRGPAADPDGHAKLDPRAQPGQSALGRSRIHGELPKLGIDVAPSTVAKDMVKGRGSPSQSWSTFLRNRAPGVAAMDLFVVPTATFKLLFGFLILRHDRRQWLHVAVTAHPTADWIAREDG